MTTTTERHFDAVRYIDVPDSDSNRAAYTDTTEFHLMIECASDYGTIAIECTYRPAHSKMTDLWATTSGEYNDRDIRELLEIAMEDGTVHTDEDC